MRRATRGLTLIELLVALVIGLILTLAVAAVMINSETLRRTSGSVSELNLSGSVLGMQLDRQLRSAGTGFTQRRADTYGCRLYSARNTNAVLPRPGSSAYPAPFQNVTGPIRLAPVLIDKGQGAAGSDVLFVMAGTGGFSESSIRVNAASTTSNSLLLPSVLGIRPSDVVLVSDRVSNNCMVQQVDPGFTPMSGQLLTFGGRLAVGATGGVSLTGFSGNGQALLSLLGNAETSPPIFTMYAVGDNNILFSYDLLRSGVNDNDTAVPFYENVVEMRALYGVTNVGNNAGTIDAWIDPVDTDPEWSFAALTDGSAAAAARLQRIVAVRVGLIVRTALPERDPVAPQSIVLFPDLPPAQRQTRNLLPAEQNLRHRIVDITVPLRTVQLQFP